MKKAHPIRPRPPRRRMIPAVLATLAGAALLMGCDPLAQRTSLVPPTRPADLAPEPKPPSAESQRLARYYGTLQQDLLTRGLLRTDGGGPETPYDADDLRRNFEQIAFYDEYGSNNLRTSGALGRWQGPVRLRADFGPSVSAEQQQKDRATLEAYAARLARITGHPISTTTSRARANFNVIFAGADDSAYVARRVRDILPSISDADLQVFANPPQSYYCLVRAGGLQADPSSYMRGVALIRAEHPDLARQSCIHEEIAQGLGLRNDSPQARPSIFNDDDEFALLTSQDEKLLQILYDPRLHPGMSADEARPIVQAIAYDIMGEPR
ncbi:ATP-dependent transcriptional regulator [Phaeobacter gallaeciensis]|uniref:ATP-dependent transcriptional regulator n=2 Tax=Phaeobacter gallaeciensis TaxID=60890 RepID=A0AAC9Z7P4_9RHOB|nr:hypothetical protein Gal_01193 [Phaeobacter gallaeciensis DSM 26640]ATE92230.1 ATP-dependent transcriptional regulator [Phaeobacter gallaeciensis]ATE97951.1 ATP-dependent transcriptional regulator [Phaeobacter gallaeciensis]ATF00892.1 ATP-dependent transcriptional regulator [Phaeobacter gallaeciensis]ATF05272.1 ATP-dependent transcriptional regulator [Phaeobacter gallaeciensis]